MADSIWRAGRRLSDCLFESAHEFDFFQAVRLLALIEMDRAPSRSFKNDDMVRFAVETSTAFPASAVAGIVQGTGGRQPRMAVTFLGLIGPSGVLPLSYSEIVIQRRILGDPSLGEFFDIFHHRLLSLFYCAWEKHHFLIGLERAGRTESDRDAFTSYLFDLIGMGTPGLQGRMCFPDRALLRYAGLLAQRPRSAECLRTLLHDYLGVPTAIEQFVGRWYELDRDELCALGAGDSSSKLGEGAVAGDAVWNRQGMVRVTFGPLTAQEFFDFLPDGKTSRRTADLIRWFLGPVIDFEIQVVVAKDEAPEWCSLGGDSGIGPRMGWCSWLTEDPFPEPAADAVFSESECVFAAN